MEIYIKPATEQDYYGYYLLRCDENNIRWTGHSKAPNKAKLEKWFNDQLKSRKRHIYIVKNEEKQAIGYLYIDLSGEICEVAEISYGVLKAMTGRGVGSFIVNGAINCIKEQFKSVKKIIAWIAVENIPSINIIIKYGFKKSSEKKSIYFKEFEKNIEMNSYVFYL